MSSSEAARRKLIRLLKLACSGELAASLAYRGHWRSCSKTEEIERIRGIEEEELVHREDLEQMLTELGEAPSPWLELKAKLIGYPLGFLCHLSGWLLPMYGAGRLESRNVREYETAARHAWDAGRTEWVECLLVMAEVEWDHERYFREKVASHPLGRRLRLWPAPPPKENIRRSFHAERGPWQPEALVLTESAPLT
ncbi:MAG: hypothetical protein RL885_09195 [Planctomycetota bacterium]